MVTLANISLTIWGYWSTESNKWGFFFSLTGSLLVLIFSLNLLTRTIRAEENAFPNENFVRVNVWNLIIFLALLIFTLLMDIFVNQYEKAKGGMPEMTYEESITFLRLNKAQIFLTATQYIFSQFMNMFLLYLIHTFTKDKSDKRKSVAFLQTEGAIRELVQDHVELNEESRAKQRFKY